MEPQKSAKPGEPAVDGAAREKQKQQVVAQVAQLLEKQIAASGLGREAFARVEVRTDEAATTRR